MPSLFALPKVEQALRGASPPSASQDSTRHQILLRKRIARNPRYQLLVNQELGVGSFGFVGRARIRLPNISLGLNDLRMFIGKTPWTTAETPPASAGQQRTYLRDRYGEGVPVGVCWPTPKDSAQRHIKINEGHVDSATSMK